MMRERVQGSVSRFAWGVALSIAGLGLACGNGGASSAAEDANGGSASFQSTACERDGRKDIYTAGLAKQNAGVRVAVVEANPSPPRKGANTMTLEVTDASGKPLDGASVVVTPWMPDHAHGSALAPLATSVGAGRYAVSKLYFPMAGLWQITVSVQPPGLATEDVTFNFCFDG